MPVGVGALMVFGEGWGSRISPSAIAPEARNVSARRGHLQRTRRGARSPSCRFLTAVGYIISCRGAEGTQ